MQCNEHTYTHTHIYTHTHTLLEELKTVAAEVKKNQIEDAVGSSWAALEAEEDSQRREVRTLLVKARERGEGGRGERTGGGGWSGARGGGGVEQRELLKDPLATQPDRENESSQTNRGVGGVCVGVVSRVQSRPSRALHAHLGKILQDIQNLESTAMKKTIVRFRGAREKGAMVFVGCLGSHKKTR